MTQTKVKKILNTTLKEIIDLTEEDFGTDEKNVENKMAIKLLELFGHKTNDIYCKGIGCDIVLKNLPIVVLTECKSFGKDLRYHFSQIEKYSYEESADLSLLTNGEEILFFSPKWIGRGPFDKKLIFKINSRKELLNPKILEKVTLLLDRKRLSDLALFRENIRQFEENIESKEKTITQHEQKKKEHQREIDKIVEQTEEIQKEIPRVAKISNESKNGIFSNSGFEIYINKLDEKLRSKFNIGRREKNKKGSYDWEINTDYLLKLRWGKKKGYNLRVGLCEKKEGKATYHEIFPKNWQPKQNPIEIDEEVKTVFDFIQKYINENFR